MMASLTFDDLPPQSHAYDETQRCDILQAH